MRRSSGWEGAGAMAAEVREAKKVVVGVELDTWGYCFSYTLQSEPTRIYDYRGQDYYYYEEFDPNKDFDLKTLFGIYYYRGGATTATGKSGGFATRTEHERDLVGVERLRAKRSVADVPELENGVTVTQVIADCLREVGARVILELAWRYGETLENVQWCVTVPSSNWDDHTKKLMEVCMERAGLIRSASSPGGSPHPLRILHALEAAARCCLRDFPDRKVKCGDKFLVAHVGEETFDVAVQEVVLAGKSGYRMKAVAERFGVSGGALNVDQQFNKLACAKIPFLEEFLRSTRWNLRNLDNNFLSMEEWCSRQDSDMPFDIDVPSKVQRLWAEFDKENGNSPRNSYERVQLTNPEMKAVFKSLLDQIVPVIADQLLTTPNVKAIFIIPQPECPDSFETKIKEGLGCLHTAVFGPQKSRCTVSQGALVVALDEVWKEDAELFEHELASSSHGKAEGLSAHGSTGSPVWSGNCSSGGAHEPAPVSKPTESIAEDVVRKYSWEQILQFTDGLSSSQLGKGGFGTVYLGNMEYGKEVAVKILDPSSQQGMPEFVNEVNHLKRVNHVNLVKLLGYCQTERQVLVYEFAEEGSIGDHLHGERTRLDDWKQRLNIALQAACGLEYLHTLCSPRIIHRDIKSENILLTRTMVAKVADFGLSRSGADEDASTWKTHFTTKVMGTRGYLDPEYHLTGQLRQSSDVYSFGIVLLEIITGRRPVPNSDPRCCIGNWVERSYGRGGSKAVKAVADSAFGGRYDRNAMKLVIELAMSCIKPSGESRPEMSEVVRVLRQAQTLEVEERKSRFPFL